MNPRFRSRVRAADDTTLTIEITTAAAPFKEAPEVAVTRFSTGADFAFADRGIPLPLSVV